MMYFIDQPQSALHNPSPAGASKTNPAGNAAELHHLPIPLASLLQMATSPSTADENKPTLKKENPFVKVKDNAHALILHLDLPGYHSDNISISLDHSEDQETNAQGMVLTVAGKRSNQLFEATFQKKFRLQETRLDLDNIDAELVDGLLSIKVAKKDSKSLKRIISIRTTPSTSGGADSSKVQTSDEHTQGSSATKGKSEAVKTPRKTSSAEIRVETVNNKDDDDFAKDKCDKEWQKA